MTLPGYFFTVMFEQSVSVSSVEFVWFCRTWAHNLSFESQMAGVIGPYEFYFIFISPQKMKFLSLWKCQ